MKKILLASLIFISCKAAQTNDEPPGAAQAGQARQNNDNDEKAAKERLEQEYDTNLNNAFAVYMNKRDKGYEKELVITQYFHSGNKALATYVLNRLELMNKGKDKK